MKLELMFPPLSPSLCQTCTAPPLPLPEYSDQGQVASLTYGFNTNLEITNYTGAIQWWHNGTAITANTTEYMLLPAMNRLQIIDVSFSDAGIYQAELLDRSPVRQFAIFDVSVLGKHFDHFFFLEHALKWYLTTCQNF